MRLYCYIQEYHNERFPITSGATEVETITEKLDSFTFQLDNVPKELELEPFQFVRIVGYDNDNIVLNKLRIIDDFASEEVNLVGETKYFSYTIKAMSVLKYFEKFDVPNRTILHSKVEDRKTIAEVVKEMCDLYIPRVKVKNGTKFEYQSLFDYQTIFNETDLFNVACPDLSWNNPSLREVITTLFLYVGCLPTFDNYKLTYINLRKDKVEFFDSQNPLKFRVAKSLSSDSYVNTLVNPLTKTLDEGNKVVNEVIGFRDTNNVLLRLKNNNLNLQTSLPIERVNKLEFLLPRVIAITFTHKDYNFLKDFVRIPNDHTIEIENTTNSVIDVEYYSYEIEITSTSSQAAKMINKTQPQRRVIEFNQTLTIQSESGFNRIHATIILNGNTYVVDSMFYNRYASTWENANISFLTYFNFDITSLVKEAQVRKQLDVDFRKVQRGAINVSLETLASNYFTTVEYTYGDNKITGFAQSFDFFNFLFTDTTYLIEVWLEYFSREIDGLSVNWGKPIYRQQLEKQINEILDTFNLNGAVDMSTFYSVSNTFTVVRSVSGLNAYPVNELSYPDEMSTFALCLFNIDYVPFNNLRTKFHKEKIDIPIEIGQIDTQENSIITFDEFSNREQQKINRLGNPLGAIVQPQHTLNEIIDIGANVNSPIRTYKGSDIFQRETQYYQEHCESNYRASKNYVMRDYFTALQTKYRAYEYVGLNQSVERKENVHTYVRIGYDKLEYGTNKIYGLKFEYLASALFHQDTYLLTYAVETSGYYVNEGETISEVKQGSFKQDISLVTNDTSLIINYNNIDSASYGVYIKNYDTSISSYEALGGFVQSWYMHASEYDTSHRVWFTNIHLDYGNNYVYGSQSDYNVSFKQSTALPLLNDENGDYVENHVFMLRNQLSNTLYGQYMGGESGKRLYYKSIDERINESVQFEYYSESEDINFTKWLVEYNGLKQNIPSGYTLASYWSSDNVLNDKFKDIGELAIYPRELIGNITNFSCGCSVVLQPINYTQAKPYLHIVLVNGNDYVDLICVKFRSNENHTISFSLNDTKTDYVYSLNSVSQIYEYTNFKVDTTQSSREISALNNG